MKTARLIAVSRRLTRPMSLGGVRRFAVGRDAIALLQIGAEAVHEPEAPGQCRSVSMESVAGVIRWWRVGGKRSTM